MEIDTQQQLDKLEKRIILLEGLVNQNEYSNLSVFLKKVLLKSDLILPSNVRIFAGTQGYTDATIKAQVGGTAGTDYAASSIYLGSNATTPGVWVLVSTTWTKLTIN